MEFTVIGLSAIFAAFGHWLRDTLIWFRQLFVRQASAEFGALQMPNSEELRAIYRDIDLVAGITDPDLVTPEAPKIQPNIYEGVGLSPGEYAVRSPILYGSKEYDFAVQLAALNNGSRVIPVLCETPGACSRGGCLDPTTCLPKRGIGKFPPAGPRSLSINEALELMRKTGSDGLDRKRKNDT